MSMPMSPVAAGSALGGLRVGFDLGVVGLQLLGLYLLRLLHGVLDLRPHVGHPDHDETRLPGVEVLVKLLEVVAAHPGGRVTGDRAEDGAAGGGERDEASADRGEREQRHDQGSGQSYGTAEYATDPGRR